MVRPYILGLLTLGMAGACSTVAGLEELDFAGAGGTSAVGGFGGSSTSQGGGGGNSGGGGATGGSSSFTDDELDGEFGEGTFETTVWDGSRLALPVGQPSGVFTSRVFDAGVAGARWETLEWGPDAPYDKALPNDGASESGYLEGNADMTGNIFLLHLDGTGQAPHGTLLPESSGKGYSPTVWHATGAAMAHVPGVHGNGIYSTLDDHLFVDIPANSDFDFVTGDFTWGLWAKTTQDCTGAKTWMGIENAADVHIWLGCKSETSSCCDSTPGTYSGGHFVTGPTDGTCYCGNQVIADDTWHHVMMVKSGHANAEIRLFVDGQRETTTLANLEMPIIFDGTVFTVGAFDFFPPDTPAHQSFGELDEVVVFNRGLSDAEVEAIYLRGRLQLRFQARVCQEADCADDPPFIGPDGSDASHYVDEGLAAPVIVELDALPAGRYLQYRAELQTLHAGATPALRHVTVTAQR